MIFFKKWLTTDRILFGIFLAVVLGLRLWRGTNLFYFGSDEDVLALTAKRILIDHQQQFVGFPIPGGIFVGPGQFYTFALIYLVIGMNPLNLPILASSISVFTILLVYFAAKSIFENKSVGIIAAILYGTSYLVALHSRILTGLTPGPIYALLVYLVLFQNVKFKKPRNLLWLAVLLSLASQNEGSNLSLLILTLAVYIFYRFKVPRAKFFRMALIFFTAQLPFLIFDALHNFFYLKSDALFFIGKQSILKEGSLYGHFSQIFQALTFFPKTFARFLIPKGVLDVSYQHSSCADKVVETNRIWSIDSAVFWLSALVLVVFVIWAIGNKKIIGARILVFHLLILFAGLLFFTFFVGDYFYEWILVIFLPGFAMISAFFLCRLLEKGILGKLLVTGLLIFFVFVNTRANLESENKFGLLKKVEAVKYVMGWVGDEPFYIENFGSCLRHGFIYLFWYFGRLPKQVYGTADFFAPHLVDSWDNNRPNNGILISDGIFDDEAAKFRYEEAKSQAVETKKIGGIEVSSLR